MKRHRSFEFAAERGLEMPTTPGPTPTTRASRAVPTDLAHWLMVAPALLIAPFVAIDRAAAACDPSSPVNRQTVTCTQTTTNPNGSGYGTATDTGNTIIVQPGASVTGSIFGLRFN